MLQRIACYIRNRRGQALVEMALVLPLLILLVMGIMEFGLLMHQVTVATEAARAGVRQAAVSSNYSTIQTAIDTAAPNLNLEDQKISIVRQGLGNQAKVTISGNYKSVTTICDIIGKTFPIQVSAVMRQEVP